MKDRKTNISHMKESHDLFGLISETRNERVKRKREALKALLDLAREGTIGLDGKVSVSERMKALLDDDDKRSRELAKDILFELASSDLHDEIMGVLEDILTGEEETSKTGMLGALSVLARLDDSTIRRIDPPTRIMDAMLPLLQGDDPELLQRVVQTMRILIERGCPDEPIDDEAIVRLVSLMSGDEPALITEIERLLGVLAGKVRTKDVIEAGAVKAMITASGLWGEDVERGTAFAFRELAETGGIEAIILEGGLPILQMLVRIGAWDMSSEVIETLDRMEDPQATILVKDVVEKKGMDLERDTFRDVYEFLRDPGYENLHERVGKREGERVREREMRGRKEVEVGGAKEPGSKTVASEEEEGGKEEAPRTVEENGASMATLGILRTVLKVLRKGPAVGAPDTADEDEKAEENGRVGEDRGTSTKDTDDSMATTIRSWTEIPFILDELESGWDNVVISALNELQSLAEHGKGETIIEDDGIARIMEIPARDNEEVTRLSKRLLSTIIHKWDWWDDNENELVDQFLPFLESSELELRRRSFDNLRMIDEQQWSGDIVRKRAAAEIVKLLEDDDSGIRLAAIVFAGDLGSARAIRPLRQIIETESDEEIVNIARGSLEKLM